MINIRFAEATDIHAIHSLAHEIWWPTYRNILTAEQIAFMLEKMYSPEALAKQFDEGATFIIAEREAENIGFASYSADTEQAVLCIHKLYILPSEQGKGTGKTFMNFIEDEGRKEGLQFLELNVNRNNQALGFYRKSGFTVYQEVDIPYYAFVLNDYVLRRTL
jgi:diamine N-acetyltransferase